MIIATFVADFMGGLKKITKLRELTGITLGVMVAVSILFSQSFYYEYLDTNKAEVKADSSGDNDDARSVITISQDAVSSVAQVVLNQALHFISNIYLAPVSKATAFVDQRINFNSFFRTLFRLIISPNAP